MFKLPQPIAIVETENHVVRYHGERKENGHYYYTYEVFFSSFGCGVSFCYMPIAGEGEDDKDEDGRIPCDVDIQAGGDCVGVPTVLECIQVAWEVHEKLKPADRFLMTDG